MKRPLIAVVQERIVTLAIGNMTCVHCPISVTRAPEGIDGVVEITVDYGTKRATVRFDDATTSWKSIARASSNAGFPAGKAE